jgi:50S ribosomal protein L16 3-hydroxylase
MAWRRARKGARLYANGEAFELPVADARRIAAATELGGVLYASLSETGRDAVFALLEAGHYRFPGDEDD